jgi:hypothetical protein
MGRAKQYVNPIWVHILEGGVFGPDILNHFSNVKYLALAQGRTGLLSHSSAAAKRIRPGRGTCSLSVDR